MTKRLVTPLVLLFSSNALAGQVGNVSLSTPSDSSRHSYSQQACDRINAVYSACEKRFDYNGRDFSIPLPTGRRNVFCSDGRRLGFYDRVDDMDMASIFMFPYDMGGTPRPEVRRNWDPGRLRQEDLLKAIYGNDAKAVGKSLVKVPFLNQTVPFNEKLGAADALARAGREIMAEAKTDKKVAKFIEIFTSKRQAVYTFTWRIVAGTNRLSPHSFGTGLDLLTHVGPQYWLWDERQKNPEKAKKGEQAYRDDHYLPKGPPVFEQKVVDILERNGFVWGGKWNHYDTMHFEYRPEFIPDVAINCPSASGFAKFSQADLDSYLDQIERSVHTHSH